MMVDEAVGDTMVDGFLVPVLITLVVLDLNFSLLFESNDLIRLMDCCWPLCDKKPPLVVALLFAFNSATRFFGIMLVTMAISF